MQFNAACVALSDLKYRTQTYFISHEKVYIYFPSLFSQDRTEKVASLLLYHSI